MTNEELRSQLLNVICQADARASVTDPGLNKAQVWNRLMRQINLFPDEDGFQADEEIVNEKYVAIFTSEFTFDPIRVKKLTLT